MPRIKVEFPKHVSFVTTIPVRITDLNYGGHVGNDTILSLIHEFRMQFLLHLGYASELKVEGVGLIMTDVAIEFKNEMFYGEELRGSVAVEEISKVGFELYYKLEKSFAKNPVAVALAKTGMVCFDYENRKIAPIPGKFRQKLEGLVGKESG